MKKLITVILVFFLLCGLLFLVTRADEEILGDNYYYLPEHEAYDIGYPGGGIIYKSSEKYLFSNVIIKGNVIILNNNKDFIIAIQLEDDSFKIDKKRSFNYYIIKKKSDLIYGPYKKEEYIKKREELKVPKELVSENGQSYDNPAIVYKEGRILNKATVERYHSPVDWNTGGLKSLVINRYDASYYSGSGPHCSTPINPPVTRYMHNFYFWG